MTMDQRVLLTLRIPQESEIALPEFLRLDPAEEQVVLHLLVTILEARSLGDPGQWQGSSAQPR
jgi:hypothetical protein